MTLAAMVRTDPDALLCDFAETYHIFDLKGLPLSTTAALAVGLREDSRIKLAMSGQPCSLDTMLLASISDALRRWVWLHTEDGQRGTNPPKSFVKLLTDGPVESSGELTFDSPEAFDAARDAILGRTH